jgi:hypothetical protein
MSVKQINNKSIQRNRRLGYWCWAAIPLHHNSTPLQLPTLSVHGRVNENPTFFNNQCTMKWRTMSNSVSTFISSGCLFRSYILRPMQWRRKEVKEGGGTIWSQKKMSHKFFFVRFQEGESDGGGSESTLHKTFSTPATIKLGGHLTLRCPQPLLVSASHGPMQARERAASGRLLLY